MNKFKGICPSDTELQLPKFSNDQTLIIFLRPNSSFSYTRRFNLPAYFTSFVTSRCQSLGIRYYKIHQKKPVSPNVVRKTINPQQINHSLFRFPFFLILRFRAPIIIHCQSLLLKFSTETLC